MRRLAPVILSLVLVLASLAPAVLAQERSARVTFAPGSSATAIDDRIAKGNALNYLLDARAGQRLTVTLTSASANVFFNILPGTSKLAYYNGAQSGNAATVILPESGVWVVQVYQSREAAWRGAVADFRLSIALSGRPLDQAAPGADGASGPAWFVVAGVEAGQLLNLRAGPSTGERVVARVDNGTVLRNGGCGAGGLWCRVTSVDGGLTAWASARYLRDAGGPEAGAGLDALPDRCRVAVGHAFGVPFDGLHAAAAEGTGQGFEVRVQSFTPRRDFTCRFGSGGQLLGIN